VLDDLKVGVSYQNRVLGRVIEDVSTDGANTYIIANPGEWSQTEENRLNDLIAHTDNADARTRLTNQLALLPRASGCSTSRAATTTRCSSP